MPCTRLNALQQRRRACGGYRHGRRPRRARAPEVAKRSQRRRYGGQRNSRCGVPRLQGGAFSASTSTTPGCWIPTPCCSISRNLVSGWLPDEQVRAKGGTAALLRASASWKREGFAPTFAVSRAARCHKHAQFIARTATLMDCGRYGCRDGLALREDNGLYWGRRRTFLLEKVLLPNPFPSFPKIF